MKTRPILFNGAMVRAILDGRKTQTRRIVKPQPDYFACGWPCTFGKECSESHCLMHHKDGKHLIVMKSPYGKVGDQLYVRETWRVGDSGDCACYEPCGQCPSGKTLYKLDFPNGVEGWKWKPSIHMPRKYSRITLEITGVRVERLMDISEVDALLEGISSVRTNKWERQQFAQWRALFDAACEEGKKPPLGPTPKRAYQALWESINGKGSWEANPWVWVIEFKVVKA